MASVLRAGLANLNSSGLLGGLCKLTPKRPNVSITQIAGITNRELRKDRPPKPPPFDWRRKNYGFWAYFLDPMFERIDDNTKLIVVDGPPCVGKDKLAKKLAEEFEMLYMPPPSFDEYYVDHYGFDLRSLNNQLPEDAQFADIKTILENPMGRNTAVAQIDMLALRCGQYIDCLAHVLSTGQGVVAQRSPWSDAVFMHAMAKCNYVSRGALEYYREAVRGTLHQFFRPHLVVYLDAPVSVVQENIKKRNIPYEVNSKALTTEYLTEIDRLYKDYLREVSKHSHLLIYDWSREGDVGVIIEDIERLDFDNVANDQLKFHDWFYFRENDLINSRWEFAHTKSHLMGPLNIARFDIPELIRSAEDQQLIDETLLRVHTQKYAPGFHPDFDKGVLFKLDEKYEDRLPGHKMPREQK